MKQFFVNHPITFTQLHVSEFFGHSVIGAWRFLLLQAQIHDVRHTAIDGPTQPWKQLNSVVTISGSNWLREDLLLKQVYMIV